MRFHSFFSGGGMIDLGLERAGLTCASQTEIDPHCRRVLARHWPAVPRFGDVTKVRGADLGPAELVCGGWPCQDLSVAGRRAGLAGERSGLFYQFVRLADEVAAPWFLGENVPGLLSSRKGEDFAAVLEALTGFRPEVPEGGWRNSGVCVGPKRGCAWRVLDAQHFGVPQRRRRVFLVAHTGGGAGPAAVLFEPESCGGHPPPRREAGAGVAGSLGAGSPGAGWRDDFDRAGAFIPETGFCLRSTHRGVDNAHNFTYVAQRDGADGAVSAKWAKGTSGPAGDEYQNLVAHTLRGEGHDASEDGSGRGTPLVVAVQEDNQNGVCVRETAGSLRADAPGHQPCGSLVAYQCHGNNVGPMGTVRQGNGSLTGGVPFVAQAFNVQAEYAEGAGPHAQPATVTKCVDHKGLNPDCQQGGTVVAYGIGSDAVDRSGEGAGGTPAERSGLNIVENCQPALRARATNSVAAGMAIRRLTPLETTRLMGLPDDWLNLEPPLSDSTKYRVCGNGAVVTVLEWIGRRLWRAAS